MTTSAKPIVMTNPPTEDSRLSQFQPSSPEYVWIRRGMPRRPVRCIMKKVMLKPMKTSQNAGTDNRCTAVRPVSKGSQ